MASSLYAMLLLLLPLWAYAAKDCYFPDGSLADNVYPCTDGDEDSMCCELEGTCLTNGLCFDGHGLGRGPCTD